jgi:hypothetical protein
VHLTYEELSDLISRIREILKTETDSEQHAPYEMLEISDPRVSWRLDARFPLTELIEKQKRMPLASGMRYVFETYGRAAPISRVEILLSDYIREVTIRGTHRDRAEIAFSTVNEILSRNQRSIAGPSFRFWAGVLLYLIASTFISLPIAWVWASRRERVQLNKNALLVCAFAGFWLFAVLIFVPWAEILPGAGIFAGTASFTERYSSLVWAAVSIVVPETILLLRWFVSKGKKPLSGTQPP